jgi:hypothetical protein
MMKGKPLTATMLRLVLCSLLFAIAIVAGIIITIMLDDQLKPFAVDVSHTVIDANASNDNVQKIQKIQKELANDKDAIDRASSIVADSQSYEYQDQIITDLNDYANRASIVITNIDFSAGTASKGTTTPAATPAPAGPTGVKSTPISVTLKNPVVYDNLLRFIKSIEQNLTKMQISKVSLAKGAGSNDISSEVLTIEVYIR